ncbi:MAG: methyltransferase domain-containing protein [Hyphomicrobiaceae bacterium]
MSTPTNVALQYTRGGLALAIRDGVLSLGKTPETVTIDDLAPVDEFHVGGRKASEEFIGQLGLTAGMRVLDIGCGLGGTARYAAERFEGRVTGIDLTREYIDTGNTLCQWVGLEERVSLRRGNALAMPFEDGAFDAAYMLHAGMNIADKQGLTAEVARVLKPGATFGIYDIMRTGPGDLVYPVPWADTPDLSALAAPADYKGALQDAGFSLTAERDRRDFALEFFSQMRSRAAGADGPPPLGLHVLMGRSTPEKVRNMIANITEGRIAPVELIARKG